ncbi:MAG: DUF3344 domain-containing protein, partial [Methanophagales archaeon]|nr:DUF3344 domain-containing protein [Methanophagales archaeon]
VQGGVYVHSSAADGIGLSFPPYTQTFDMPDGTIKWARLWVGVWGGTEKYDGWLHVKLNNHDLGRTNLLGENDANQNVYCTGHGVYWVYYDVTGEAVSGLNTATANTSRSEPRNKLDGRVYGIALAAVYEDSSKPKVEYWIADGNVNLYGKGWCPEL